MLLRVSVFHRTPMWVVTVCGCVWLCALLSSQLLETRDPDRVVLALMRVMEPLRCLPFTLIYGVAGISEANHPSPDFVQQIFDLFACR